MYNFKICLKLDFFFDCSYYYYYYFGKIICFWHPEPENAFFSGVL